MDYLDIQRTQVPPDTAAVFAELGRLYQQKLYHQLSIKLLELIQHPHFAQNQNLFKLYENFVVKIDKKIKPSEFARFAIAASRQLPANAQASAFLEGVKKLVDAKEIDANILLNMELVELKVGAGKLDECKQLLETNKQMLDSRLADTDPTVNAAYYHAAVSYYQIKGPASEFFNNAMLYLAYVPLNSLPVQEQIKFASDVSLAALVGNNVYNFGELLQHPIIQVLKGTQYEWLLEFLQAFSTGDIAKYTRIAEEKAVNQEVLEKNGLYLNQKIRIMALMEMVLKRPSDNRTITFKEVSQTCAVPVSEVELLLMKTFSLKVVKGVIDQVDQTVRIKWVQPRVLDKTQIAVMRDRMLEWSKEVGNVALYLEENAPEIIHKQ